MKLKIWTCALVALAFVASAFLTRWMRAIAATIGAVDRPNERSSHSVPTPRGGGVAIVISSLVAIGVLTASGIVAMHLFLAIAGGGAAVALVGFVDDYRTLSARTRLVVHLIAAGWAVFWIGPAGIPLPEGHAAVVEVLEATSYTVGIVWFLNIFNFMDGIDGIAAAEATYICVATALLAGYLGAVGLAAVALVLGAASAGFLVWNWPPAKIFMGDAGSGYLGFVLAVLAVFWLKLAPGAIWTWIILAGVFVVDSTVTLARRMWRGEPLATAHRMHAYQHAAVRFGHARVTATVIIINGVWLLPLGVASALRPEYAMATTVIALFPIGGLAVVLGAGCKGGNAREKLGS